MTSNSKESAFSRWSRRKQEARREAEQSLPEPAPEAPAEAGGQPVEPVSEAEKPILTDADMPDIDSLDENSDFSPFMSEGVSEELRNLALRKMFHAPIYNIRDGLDEYDDDFTSFEKLGDVVTADMKHRIEMEQKKLREALAEEESAEGTESSGEVAEASEEDGSAAEAEAGDDGETDEASKVARLDDARQAPTEADDEP